MLPMLFRTCSPFVLLLCVPIASIGCSGGGAAPATASAAAPAPGGPGGGAGPAIPISAAAVVKKSMPLGIQVVGTAEAHATVAVHSQITGELTSVNFRDGENVTKGQVLATLDRRPLESAL